MSTRLRIALLTLSMLVATMTPAWHLPAGAVAPAAVALPRVGASEGEPNGAPNRARALAGNPAKHRGEIYPADDEDWYRFTGAAGNRVDVMAMAATDPTGRNVSISLVAADGTVIERDSFDGAFDGGVIAGARLPAAGTYYLRVRATSIEITVTAYDLYVHVRTGTVPAETEPNSAVVPQTLPASGRVSGTLSNGMDLDGYSVALNAGDTLFVALDGNPSRGDDDLDGRLSIGPVGGPRSTVNTSGLGTPDAEGHLFTARASGMHVVVVDSPTAQSGAYRLGVTTIPRAQPSCRRYANAASAVIGPATPATSQVTVTDAVSVGRFAVELDLDHARLSDLDVVLTAPNGNNLALFTEAGPFPGPAVDLQLLFDASAAAPIGPGELFTGQMVQVARGRSMEQLAGLPGLGNWTLSVYDDVTADATGTLNGWALVLCDQPPPAALPPVTLFSTGFEAGESGFTHTGANDEWEYGTPAAPISGCANGTKCWDTDLDSTYEDDAKQTLVSPTINLKDVAAPVTVTFAHKFQLEGALFDQYTVEIRDVNDPTFRRILFEHKFGTMAIAVGAADFVIPAPSGWATVRANVNDFIGRNVQLRWRVISDTSISYAGVAVDDVAIRARPGLSCTTLSLSTLEDKSKSKAPSCTGGTKPYTATVTKAPARGSATGGSAVTYKPKANLNGPDSFTTSVKDKAGLTKPMPVTVTITAVNDPPRFSSGPDQMVKVSAGAQSVPGWATSIKPGPPNESTQSVSFVARVVSRTGTFSFAAPPTIGAAGRLRYAVRDGKSGVATIGVRAVDSGSGAAPNVNGSVEKFFTITAE